MTRMKDQRRRREKWREWHGAPGGVNRSLIQHIPSVDICTLLNKAFDTGATGVDWESDILTWYASHCLSGRRWAEYWCVHPFDLWAPARRLAGGVFETERRGSFSLTQYQCWQESVTPNLLRRTPFNILPAKLRREMDQKPIPLISICYWFHRWITPSPVIRSSLCSSPRLLRQ